MLNILVTGAAGKMGKAVVNAVHADARARLAAAVEVPSCPVLGQDAGQIAGVGPKGVSIVSSLDESVPACDCMIDFSSVEALPRHLDAAVKHRKAIVIGTTGIGEGDRQKLQEASRTVPVIWAPNFSVGVTLLGKLCAMAAGVLSDGFDIEIVETHHRMKKDAPSGTALKLLAAVRGDAEPGSVVNGRSGMVGERPRAQIGVLAVRGGDVVGDHTVHFLGTGERLEITHRATTRDTFARGALRAAHFIVKSGPGLYTMEQVLGL